MCEKETVKKMSKWSNIKLIISDFDGVMTDNRALMDEDGREWIFVNRADGQAVHILRAMGIDLAIISTETNRVVTKRAEKLNVECVQGIQNKAECLKEYCNRKGILLKDVVYVGNDVNDYDAMQLAGIKIAPHDAYGVVKDIADYVTEVCGGYGVIREIAEVIKEHRE